MAFCVGRVGIGMADAKIAERFSSEMNDRQETTDKLLSIMFGESAVEELRKYEDGEYSAGIILEE